MTALSQIMNAEEVSHALKLTNFNHEEECQRLKLLAAIHQSIRTSLEAAEKLAEEEASYARIIVDAEQARIAAEEEHKRLAEEEALKILVDRALHIAEIETKRLAENQEMGPQLNEDHIMVDQNLDEPATDKGKAVIVDTTPPRSPVKIEQGSASSAIPPAVQMALEEMKNEMKEELRNEIDELRADMNRAGEATHKKIDEMMQFLHNLASQFQKP
jgi:hypothetical protein